MDTIETFDEQSITEAVVRRLHEAPAERVREISAALVRHLHAFVRAAELRADISGGYARGSAWLAGEPA